MSDTVTPFKPSQLAKFLSRCINKRAPVLIKGRPGIGKTDIVTKAARDAGYDLIVSHPVVADPTDYKGLPYFTADTGADFAPFGELRRLIETKRPLVYFLDDLGQAPPLVQAATMQLLLARCINGHRVSDNVTFVAATNRRQDRAGVQGILEPVKSRFVSIVELRSDPEEWFRWANDSNLPAELIGFCKFKQDIFGDHDSKGDMVNTPSPRTLAHCAMLMQMDLPEDLELGAYAGAIGDGYAGELVAFLRVYRKLPSPETIFKDPEGAIIPKEPAVQYALLGTLARMATEKNVGALARYLKRLPAEFSVYCFIEAIKRDNQLQATQAWVEFSKQHKDVMVG